jgi:hypothetical protein
MALRTAREGFGGGQVRADLGPRGGRGGECGAAKQRRRSGRIWTSASADASERVFYQWPARLVSVGVGACKATGHARADQEPGVPEQRKFNP